MAKLRSAGLLLAITTLAVAGWAQSPGAPQGPSRPVAPVETAPAGPAFRAINYEVRASLDPIGQVINAKAKVDFDAPQGGRVLDVELNQNLRINSVQDVTGKPVIFDREDASGLVVHVTLSDTIAPGGKVTLLFDYGGPLASRLVTPNQGMRLAYIGKEGGYLLLPSRWFPLTNFPSNRYTGTFQLEVPGNMVVVGTGTAVGTPETLTPAAATAAPTPPPPTNGRKRKAEPPPEISPLKAPPPPGPENERVLYTFRVDQPEPAGTFVVAPLQLSPVQSEGMPFSVYTPPSAAKSAQVYADAVAHTLDVFNSEFGPLPKPGLTVAQLPDGTVAGFSAPGLLLISAREWQTQPNSRLIADLAAQQWWGSQVLAASPADVWVTDGLARYCEGLYVEQTQGKDALNKALEDFAVGALMFDDAPPIVEANRLQPDSEEYRSVVVDKGAMVFHMLRALVGEANFTALLKDFYSHFAGKSASINDFEKVAEAHTAAAPPPPSQGFKLGNAPPPAADASADTPSLKGFFAQWLNSTGIPEFSLDYVVYRTKSGFRIVGKVKQNLDVFHMKVEMEVETEGNPEYKTVDVVGKESPFTVETFGRPKPNGIVLDPHDYILKASAKLRVRGIIARGEYLAEQGRYYEAVQQYQKALEQDKYNALADFRMGEAFFYQRNYAAAAQSFRDAIDGATDLNTKWTEVWAHIYLGRIWDIQGDRTRAVNEYSKAKQTGDDTGGAQAAAEKCLKKACGESAS